MNAPASAPDSAPTDRVRADSLLLRAQINRQALVPRAVMGVGAALLIALAVWGAQMLLGLGQTLSYASIQMLDGQVASLLQRASPYLWAVAALVWSLMMLGVLTAWLRSRGRALRATPVNAPDFAQLAPRLGDEVLDVIGWCWIAPRREPLTLGDLHNTLAEINSGRIQKLADMRRQQDWVDGLPG